MIDLCFWILKMQSVFKRGSMLFFVNYSSSIRDLFIRIVFASLIFISGISSLCAADEWPMFKSDSAHDSLNPADTINPPLISKFNSASGPISTVAYSSPVMLNEKRGLAYIFHVSFALHG